MTQRYSYVIGEQVGRYLLYYLRDKKTGNEYRFYTDHRHEGMFVNDRLGCIRQIRGTCNYSMPNSKSAARERIKALYEEAAQNGAYIG